MGSRCVLPKPSGRRKRRCLLLPNQLRQRVRPSDDERNNIEVYQKYSRGVVNITTTSYAYDIFYRPVPPSGMGSGAIIDSQGHIVHDLQGSAQPLSRSHRPVHKGGNRSNVDAKQTQTVCGPA